MHNRSDRLQENPANTGQTGPLTGQTGPTKSEGCNSALKCATRQLSNLGVSIHDFPPLCIPADKFDAAGAEIHICLPWNKSMVATNPEQLILSKTYPTNGYNLAHIPRHARHLASSYSLRPKKNAILASRWVNGFQIWPKFVQKISTFIIQN